MTEHYLEPETRPILLYAVTGTLGAIPIAEHGATNVGDATGEGMTLDVVSAEDENEFMFNVPVNAWPELPAAGEGLEAGGIYQWQNIAVMVRQSHTRTEHDPPDVPALFLIYRENAGAALDWIAGEQVSVGTHRMFDGTEYEALQSHVTQSDWTPPVVPALWRVYVPTPEPGKPWQAGVWYAVGYTVTYDGTEYECLQLHYSQVGWEPPAVPALWQSLAPPTPEWQPWTAYVIGDIVTYLGASYQCRQSHTSQPGWEPPNVPALWLLL